MPQSSESIPDAHPNPLCQFLEYPEPGLLSLSKILSSQDSRLIQPEESRSFPLDILG